jgi:hypothetical protein
VRPQTGIMRTRQWPHFNAKKTLGQQQRVLALK